jgi:hypothetical protein
VRAGADGWCGILPITDEDRLWSDEGRRRGWRLRKPAAPLWRLWGVRHVRWAVHTVRVWHWDQQLEQLNIGPIGYEAWIAYAIRRGWM